MGLPGGQGLKKGHYPNKYARQGLHSWLRYFPPLNYFRATSHTHAAFWAINTRERSQTCFDLYFLLAPRVRMSNLLPDIKVAEKKKGLVRL